MRFNMENLCVNASYSFGILDKDGKSIPPVYKDGKLEKPEFLLEHEQEYQVYIGNGNKERKISARITIDGKYLTNLIVHPGAASKLDCHPIVGKKLVFIALESSEADTAGIKASNPLLGQIRIEIDVELEPKPKPTVLFYMEGATLKNHGAAPKKRCASRYQADSLTQCDGPCSDLGGTALGDESTQKFKEVDKLETGVDVYEFTAQLKLKKPSKYSPLV